MCVCMHVYICVYICMQERGNWVASVSKSLCCSVAHHAAFSRSPCYSQKAWWMTESSPVYASPRGEDPEGRMTELVNASEVVSRKTPRGRQWQTPSVNVPRKLF